MVSLLVDEDFTSSLLAALLGQHPQIDALRVQDAGLRTSPDSLILEFAAQTGRVLLTHDKSTMTAEASRRIRQGLEMPGMVVVAKGGKMIAIVDDIALLTLCQDPADCLNQVFFVPLH